MSVRLTSGSRLAGLFSAICLVAASCGAETAPSRADVAAGIVDQIALPAYTNLEEAANAFETTAATFCDEPNDQTLTNAVSDLAELSNAWHATTIVRVGPTEFRRSRQEFNVAFEPERIDNLNQNFSDIDPDDLSGTTAITQRGLGTAWYLLGETADASVNTPLAIAETNCDYLSAVSQSMRVEATELSADWIEPPDGSTPHIETFGSDPERVIDESVNNARFALQRVDLTVLHPLAVGDPTELDGEIGDWVIDQELDAVSDALLGVGDIDGLSVLVNDRLAETLKTQVAEIDVALAELERPIGTAGETDPSSIDRLRTAVDDLEVTLSTEVASQLGVTLAFSDADGDSG